MLKKYSLHRGAAKGKPDLDVVRIASAEGNSKVRMRPQAAWQRPVAWVLDVQQAAK